MKRILLALLVLLTGLVAQTAPVSARMSGTSETEIGASDSARGVSRPTAVQAQSIDAAVVQKERREREAMRVRPTRGRVYIPSVLFGADRAYE